MKESKCARRCKKNNDNGHPNINNEEYANCTDYAEKGSYFILDHTFCCGPQAVILVGKDYKLRVINCNVQKYRGLLFSGDIKVGAVIQNIIIKQCRDDFLENLTKAFGGHDIHSSIQIKADRGCLYWFDVYYKPAMVDKEKVMGVYVTFWPLHLNQQIGYTQEKHVEDSYYDLAKAIFRTLECRDPYTAVHQKRVAAMAKLIGQRMGFDKNKLTALYIGALLHDIGKLKIPTDILAKPASLTPLEFELIKEHPLIGYDIIKDTILPATVGEIVCYHHEKLDGSGYPDGISGDKICQEVKIVTVCDVVDAMSSFRPYRPARTRDEVVKELENGRNIRYDSQVVDAMLEILAENTNFRDMSATLCKP